MVAFQVFLDNVTDQRTGHMEDFPAISFTGVDVTRPVHENFLDGESHGDIFDLVLWHFVWRAKSS